MRPPLAQRCLKTIFFPLKTNIQKTEFYFGGPDLQYRTPKIGCPSYGIEKDNFRDSQGKQIRTENKESFEKQHCVAVAIAVCRRGFVNSMTQLNPQVHEAYLN